MIIGANHASYATKELKKTIMKKLNLQKDICFFKKSAWIIEKVQETEKLLH